MDIVKKIAAELEIRPQQVEAVIKLIDEAIRSRLLPDTVKKHMVR